MTRYLAKRSKVLVCFGTRPEIIKLAPVVDELRRSATLDPVMVTTGQHRQMLDQMLDVFGIVPDVDFGLMRPCQDLAELTGRAIIALGGAIAEREPAAVIVQGDTTTAMCAALAAFYADVPVAHVEAGLRTHDPRRPFPEEINRRLVGQLAQWHFCPTRHSAQNLLLAGTPAEAVQVTGNTVIDALLATLDRPPPAELVHALPPKAALRRILVTLHRRETQGESQRRLCAMLAEIAERPDVEVLFPVHMSPAVRASVRAELAGREGVHLMEPLAYRTFVHALRTSDLVITDSGGIQEEAPALDLPVLVMRDKTERPEGVEAGCAVLCGTDPDGVKTQVVRLLDDPVAYRTMADAPNPYGNGTAAGQIVERLERDLLPAAHFAAPAISLADPTSANGIPVPFAGVLSAGVD
jgi:UDP-N-acetylglucosamine 2-epimerase (non-hydrolysing)